MNESSVPSFEPIERKTVSEEVRAAMYSSIRSGALPPGTPLPPERILCEQFGVARTSVREAVQGLASLGLVTRRGNRTFVGEQLPSIRFDSDDLRKRKVSELFEVRRIVEVRMAELAACRATQAERSELLAIAAAFNEGLDIAKFRTLDRRLHGTIAAACGNPTFAELYHKILDTLFESDAFHSLLNDPKNSRVVRKVVREAAVEHRLIAEAIAAGDGNAAAAAADEHLNQVERNMVRRMA